jgi:hypothetical protein
MRMFTIVTKNLNINLSNNFQHCSRDICLCLCNLNLNKYTNLIYYYRCYNKSNKLIPHNKKLDIKNIK